MTYNPYPRRRLRASQAYRPYHDTIDLSGVHPLGVVKMVALVGWTAFWLAMVGLAVTW